MTKQITEGFDLGEGSYRKTTYFDTLGREIKILQIKDKNKTVDTFVYSDSSTYEETYYELGETENYSDTDFKVTETDIVFTRHARLNKRGSIVYLFTKWTGTDSLPCQEIVYDSLGKQTSSKSTNCR